MNPETKAKLVENLKKARAQRARNLKAGKKRTTTPAKGLAGQLVARARELEVEARKLSVQAKALRRAARLVE
jgi:hypothetical protein